MDPYDGAILVLIVVVFFAVAGFAVGVVAGRVSSSGVSLGGRTAARGVQAASRIQPRTFADVSGDEMQLRSSATGRLLRNLRSPHLSGSNEVAGAAFSPSGRYVYVPLYSPTAKQFVIARFPTAGGPPKLVGPGQMPALSANGRLLATVTGPAATTIRTVNLLTGQTRRFDLSKTIGEGSTMADGSIAWLGDGSELLLWPQPVPGLGAKETRSGYGLCHFSATAPRYRTNGVCLIALHPFSPRPDPHAVMVPDPKWFIPSVGGDLTAGAPMFSGLTTAPDSVLLAGTDGSRAALARVRITGRGPVVSQYVSFANSRPTTAGASAVGIGLLALDRSGTHLLYLVTNSRCHHKRHGLECNFAGTPSVWAGTIQNGHLIDTHRLSAHTQMAGLAW